MGGQQLHNHGQHVEGAEGGGGGLSGPGVQHVVDEGGVGELHKLFIVFR